MMKQGGEINRLSPTINKVFDCHFDVFLKGDNTCLEYVESLLD